MKCYLVLFLMTVGFAAKSQENSEVNPEYKKNNNRFDLTISTGINSKEGFVFGMSGELTNFKTNFGYGINVKSSIYDIENYPSNFEPSTNIFINLGSSDRNLKSLNDYYSFTAVKNVYSKNTLIKYSFQAGPSVGIHTFYDFVANGRRSGNSFFGDRSNYDIYEKHRTSLGLTLESSVGFSIKKTGYLSLLVFSNSNKYAKLLGAGLKFSRKLF